MEAETSTCPPCPAAAIRAARWTSVPTYPSAVRCGLPVWIPIRTRIGPGGQLLAGRGRGRQRTWGGREGDEERIALSVDFHPAVGAASGAEDAPMLGQGRRIANRAQLVEEPGRAFDIREQKRDGSRRQVARHGVIMPPQVTSVTLVDALGLLAVCLLSVLASACANAIGSTVAARST